MSFCTTAKTMETFKAVALVWLFLPLIVAISVEELEIKNEILERKNEKLESELIQLKEIVGALQAKLNDTEELEARVTALEESVVDLEDDMDNVETHNLLQDDRINTLEAEILDNSNDIEELVDTTTGLTIQVSSLEEDVTGLDQRVEDLESGGGGNGNITDLEIRVETLEEVTSQLSDDVSSLEDNDVTQDERMSSIEEDVTSLDQRVEDLESGGGSVNGTDYSDTTFMAVLTTTHDTNRNPLIFEKEVANPGGHYSNETGRYTVPYDGIYQFSIHLTAQSSLFGVYFFIEIDDNFTDCHVDAYPDGDQLYRATTILLDLAAGQTVHIRMYSGAAGSTTYFFSYFSGYLVTPHN